MSEEILEQQSEEELEEQNAVVEPSDDEINEAKAKSEEMEDGEEEEEEMEESFQTPKTKAGMVKAIYDQLNSMKKAELSDSFSKIMGATSLNEEEEEEDDEEEVKAGYKMENKKLKKEDLDLNVKEDMDAIMNGEELSEDFKTKATTIFEAAVSAKVISEVNQRVDALEEEFKKEIQEAKEEYKSNMSEKVDGYLNYVVEEWMKENELAIEAGIKVDMAESLMDGLKELFEAHNIEVDDETVDVVNGLEEEVAAVKEEANKTIDENVKLAKEIAALKAEKVFEEMTEELTMTQRERMKVLSEKLEFENIDEYTQNLTTLKEAFIADEKPALKEEVEEEEIITEEAEVKRPVSDFSNINNLVAALNARK